ncbi:MAG: type IV toxin-antitoxin system AbiEi family antitoxin domain-containing protein [bacterium]
MKKEIKELFLEHNGYLTTNQIPNSAIYMAIKRLVNKGVVERIRRGVYYYPEVEGELMIDTSKLIPGGVLCLYSAWFYYQLSVQIPHSYCLAVERSRKIKLPDYPLITLYY